MKDVEKSRTSFIRVNLRVLREKHLFQCPPYLGAFLFYCLKATNKDLKQLLINSKTVSHDFLFLLLNMGFPLISTSKRELLFCKFVTIISFDGFNIGCLLSAIFFVFTALTRLRLSISDKYIVSVPADFITSRIILEKLHNFVPTSLIVSNSILSSTIE